jgi:hypothetical protein
MSRNVAHERAPTIKGLKARHVIARAEASLRAKARETRQKKFFRPAREKLGK